MIELWPLIGFLQIEHRGSALEGCCLLSLDVGSRAAIKK